MIFTACAFATSSAAVFKVVSVRPQIAMFAPSRANSSTAWRPMPRLPPVTTATLPSRVPISGALACHVAVVRLAMHAAADRIDRHYIRGAHAREIDLEAIALDQPGRFLLRLYHAQLEQ